MFLIASSFCWAAGTVLARNALHSIDPIALAFVAAAFSLPVHFFAARNSLAASILQLDNPYLVIALVYSGVFSTGFSYAMWNYGVRQVGASHAAIYQNLIPIVALTGSLILLHEYPLFWQLVGGALILCGLIVMRRARGRPQAEAGIVSEG
jgi:drug/metabolite transporter (DMT)-like permease